MTHWSTRLAEVLNAQTKDLKELARIAGCETEEEIRTFYRHETFDGVDLREQSDLSFFEIPPEALVGAVLTEDQRAHFGLAEPSSND